MTERNLPVIPSDRLDDLHHLEIAAEADLVLSMDALHPQNAQKFIDFIQSPSAQEIYQKFGFLSHLP